MKYLLPCFAFVFLACSDEDSNHKTLFYTFSDQGLPAVATTGVEPETGQVVAVHISEDPADIAFDRASGNVYVSMIDWIGVYKIDDVASGDILFNPQDPTGAIAIDAQREKIYWVNQQDGKVYAHNLDGSGSSNALFGGAFVTNHCTGLAVDPTENRMYLLDAESKRLLVADLNTNDEPGELVTASDFEINDPHDLEISENGDTLYWVDGNQIVQTDAGTGTCSVFRASTANHLFLHHPTNALYLSFSREVAKTEIGGATTLQRVFQDESSIDHFVVR